MVSCGDTCPKSIPFVVTVVCTIVQVDGRWVFIGVSFVAAVPAISTISVRTVTDVDRHWEVVKTWMGCRGLGQGRIWKTMTPSHVRALGVPLSFTHTLPQWLERAYQIFDA